MAKSTESKVLEIKPVEIRKVKVRIVGTSPLIVHAWGHKAKQEMLDKQMGKTKTKSRDLKNPVQDFIDSLYWIEGKPEEYTMEAFEKAVANGARWGFPVTAIKQGAAMAASRNELGIPSTRIKGAFFIEGEGPDLLAEIKGCTPTMREDMVRVGGMTKTADIRFRGEFSNWYMDLTIAYNVNGPISIEQILNLVNMGGFTCGLGEWRPERDGSFGMYHVDTCTD